MTRDDDVPECFGDGASDDCSISCPYWEECDILRDEYDEDW